MPSATLRAERLLAGRMLAAPRPRRGVGVASRPAPPGPPAQLTARASRREKEAVPTSHLPDQFDDKPSPSTPCSSLSLPALLALASTAAAAAFPAPLLAAAGASPADYDPSSGSEVLKNVAGAAYVILIIVFAVRLLRRRAATATSKRFASSTAPEAPPPRRRAVARATPGNAAWAALQAGACATALYALCLGVDAFFDGRDLPDAYSARNIAVTLRTIGRGLAYLLTFIFAANAVGLAGLAVQLVFWPDPEDLYAAPVEDEGGDASGGGGVDGGDGGGGSSSSGPVDPS